MKPTKTQIAVIITTLILIGFNAAANLIPFNGISTAAVSDIFKTYFVPAGYVFLIWGVIYLLLLIFSFGYTVIPKKERSHVEEQIVPWYLLSSVANIVWLFCWHYGYFLTTVVAIVTVLFSLIQIFLVLQENQAQSTTEFAVLHLPFQIYLGWISVTTIANISDVAWYFGFDGFGLSGAYWAAALMIVAGILSAVITFRARAYAFAVVIIWAVIGIMVKFPAEQAMIVAGGLTIAIAIGAMGIKRFGLQFPKKKSTKKSHS